MENEFDNSKLIEFLRKTNQSDFDFLKGIRSENFLKNDDDSVYKPATFFCVGGKLYYCVRAYALEQFYCKAVIKSNYSLKFSYNDLERTLYAYYTTRDMELTLEDFNKRIEDKKLSKKINEEALNCIKEYVKL